MLSAFSAAAGEMKKYFRIKMREHLRNTNLLRIYKLLLASGFWLLATHCFTQVNSDSLLSVYTKKMQKYLAQKGKGTEVFSFTKEGIEVYIPKTDTSLKKFEYKVLWSQIDTFRNIVNELKPFDVLQLFHKNDNQILSKVYLMLSISKFFLPKDKKKSTIGILSGIKITLDPGHIAGNIETARMEKKWVEMKANPVKGIKEPIQLIEGNLTLATAKILKKKLEAQGATVMLTRDAPGISTFGIAFEKWKDSLFISAVDSAYKRGDISFEEKNFLLTKANDTEIFRRFFLQEDLRERARKINEFKPDLTLVIHYNVDETNVNWNKPTKKNFNMVFVGGSFAEDELDKPEARIDFLRLLLTDDIERSIDFSKYIIESLVKETGVPAALDSSAIYLRDNCMKTEVNGVFCRNLALTRMVKGTLCYGESLYQDNMNECKSLSKEDASTPISVTGMKTSKRVEQVADAYFEGIMNYVKSRSK